MKRREFIAGAAAATVVSPAASGAARSGFFDEAPIVSDEPLVPPKLGRINVAFAIAQNATIIDFCGPWEVFQDVNIPGRLQSMPFRLYTVAATADPVTATGGMRILPNYTVDDAPAPDLVVVPALQGNPELLDWLKEVAPETDLTMSVCTGAFQLGRAGLLDGLVATTHHDFYDRFEDSFPGVKLERNRRFVENKRIASAGGLTSGIDLALRVVDRYFGRKVAENTAYYMEYTSQGWKVS